MPCLEGEEAVAFWALFALVQVVL